MRAHAGWSYTQVSRRLEIVRNVVNAANSAKSGVTKSEVATRSGLIPSIRRYSSKFGLMRLRRHSGKLEESFLDAVTWIKVSKNEYNERCVYVQLCAPTP